VIESAGDASIAGTTPAHPAGLVDVAVTRHDGFSHVLKGAYAYASPAPKPQVVFPTKGHISGGLTVVVSGSGFISGAKVFLGGWEVSDVNIPAGNVFTFTTPAVPTGGSMALEIINPDGQKGVLDSAFTYTADDFENPPPEIKALQPDHGPYQGGTVLAVYGEGFLQGAQILFGGKPAKVHLVDEDLATVTTPPGFVGTVDVTILNPDGQSASLPNAYKYIVADDPAPTLIGVTPDSGPEAGGTAVILTGNHLTGGGIGFIGYRPVSSWTVLTEAIATGTTAKHEPGKVDVVATNGDGQSAVLKDAYLYVGAPHIISFDPKIGAVSGGKFVTIGGKNFSAEAQVFIGDKPAADVVVQPPFVITIQTPPGDPGPAAVKVINPDGQADVAVEPYTYVLPPLLTSIFPEKGSADGGTPIVLTGESFLQGAKVTFGNAEATGVVWITDQVLTALAPAGPQGEFVDVVVENVDGQAAILYKAYEYVDPADIGPAPEITSLSPPTGPTTGGTWGLLDGANLQPGAWALFGVVPVNDFEVLSDASARYVSAPSSAGTVSVTVVNPDGGFGTLAEGFIYKDPADLDDAPEIAAIDPNSGPTKGGTPVTFSGTELNDATVVFFKTTPALQVVAAAEGPDIIVTTPPHATGKVNVTVTDDEGQTVVVADGFEFVPPPPLEKIEPNKGPSSGGTFVTITGSAFIKGDTAAKSSRVMTCEEWATNLNCVDALATKTTVKDSKTITFTTPAQIAGLADVVVINPDGQAAVLAQSFQYTPPPKVLGVNPTSGSTLGGEVVEITGTGFQPGLQVTFSGVKATSVVVQDSKTITCKTPAGAPGPAAVNVSNPDLSNHTLGGGFLYIKPPKIVNVFPTLGPETGGTVVTIQGDGFVAGSVVSFGNTEVAAGKTQIESENVIKAETPPGAGPVAVKVVNPDGQFAALGGGFIYIPVIPAPQVTSATPSFGPTGGGYLVQVVGKGFLQGAQVAFGNDASGYALGFDAKVKNAGTLIAVTAPAHPAGIVNIKVTNSDGQFGLLPGGFEFLGPLNLPGLAFVGVAPDRGPPDGGYDVVIYGQGFKTGIKVFFGDEATAAWTESPKVVRLGPTLLKVTVPAYGKNGKVDIRLSNPAFGGLSDEVIATTAFTFGQSVVFDPKGHRMPIDTNHDDRRAEIFDADGDGLNDLVIAHFNGPLEMYLNTKDVNGVPGKFIDVTKQNMPAIGNYHNARYPTAIDIDSDGDQDILVMHGYSQARYVGVYRNAGDGTFTFEGKQDTGISDVRSFNIGDLNCDGLADVFVTANGQDVLMVGDGTGNFKKTAGVLPTLSEPSRGAALGDVDNDGDVDIIIANDNAAQNRLYYNNCNNIALPPTCSFAIPGCTSKVFDGHRYAICPDNRSWASAQDKCKQYGYSLMTTNNQLEHDFIAGEIIDYTWIGLKEVDTDHNYEWQFGISTYENWCGGQPNDSSVNDCTMMYHNGDGCWDDYSCGSGRDYVCEANVTADCPNPWQFTDAQYGAGKNFPVSGFNSRDVVLFDINLDGFLDAVIVNWGQSTRVYMNNGGKFNNDTGLQFPQEETLTQDAQVEAVDVDADGDLDLVMRKYLGSSNRYWPAVYISDVAQGGGGIFLDGTQVIVPAHRGEDAHLFALGDLNQDSLVDMFIINKDHQDWLFLNNGWAENKPMIESSRVGIGAFANNTFFGVPEEVADALSAAAGDIDGDGDIDIVIGYTDGKLTPGVWVNDGAGNFYDEGATRMAPDLDCVVRDVDLVDINGDGDLDAMLICNKGGRQLVNDGTGFFTDKSSGNIGSYKSGDYGGHQFGDIDGDGDIDWLWGSNGYTGWRTMINGGDVYGDDATFWVQRNDLMDPASTMSCGNCLSERTMALTDLNTDGTLDLYIGVPSGQNQLWHNDGSGLMKNVTNTHLPAISDNSNRVLAADVDFDGDVDLIVVNNGQNRLHVGELDFKYADVTASNLPTSQSANSSDGVFEDFDLDGYGDLLTSTWGGQNQLWLNKGGAVFESFTPSMPTDIDPSRCTVAADFDGDGVIDIFIGNRQANRIYLNKTPKPAP